MIERSEDELRGAATAANLRLAFEVPDREPLPSAMLSLLRRLSEVEVVALRSEAVRPRA